MGRSKLYRKRSEMLDRQRDYSLEEALQLIKEMPACNFDETVELVFRLGIDPRQSDQVVRGVVALPNGTGKTVNVVVVASGDAAAAAQAAGADTVGFEDVIERIKDGWTEFDTLIATPAAMQSLRPLGRILGPRGLMPNPKTGTLTEDTEAAVQQAKAGQVEYRADRGGCVHVPVGKRSFTAEALQQNAMQVVQAIQQARPAAAKGQYVLGLTASATMSPGIRVDLRSVVGG